MLKKEKSAYGGELLKTREGRARGRVIDTKNTMHLVLRSTKAVKAWSFTKHFKPVRAVIKKFATKYGVRIISVAVVGNHIHMHIKITNRYAYPSFIKATTGAITMVVTGCSRMNPLKKESGKFWDYRPYTRVIQSFKEYLNLKDYIEINRYEGFGYTRDQAKFLIGWQKAANTG